MGAPNNENNPDVIVAHLDTISDAGDYPVAHLPKRFKVKKLSLIHI